MIIVTVKFIIRADKKVEFLDLFNKIQPAVKQEIGCLEYNLTRALYKDNEFYLFEQWNSKMDLDIHLQTVHTREFLSKIKDMLEVPLELKQFDATEEKVNI